MENEPTRITEFLVLNGQFIDQMAVYICQTTFNAVVIKG